MSSKIGKWFDLGSAIHYVVCQVNLGQFQSKLYYKDGEFIETRIGMNLYRGHKPMDEEEAKKKIIRWELKGKR